MVPQACWRDRFIRELALDELAQDANALDWRYLYFHADQLLGKSHGWFVSEACIGFFGEDESGIFEECVSGTETKANT